MGNPFSVFKLHLHPSSTFAKVADKISMFFHDTVQIVLFDFTQITDKLDIDEVAETITVKCRYKEFMRDWETDERAETTTVTGQFTITFNFKSKLVLFGTGNLHGAFLISFAYSLPRLELSVFKEFLALGFPYMIPYSLSLICNLICRFATPLFAISSYVFLVRLR